MKTEQIIKSPLIDLPKISGKMKTLDISAAIGYYSNLAKRAAFISEYLSERYGYGCGDQGDDKALKAANKVARKVWCGALGFNAYLDISF
jgi:hypothetical protein